MVFSLSSILAQKGNRPRPQLVCTFQGPDHVFRIPAGADTQNNSVVRIERGQLVTEITGFLSSSGCVVSRVEVQNNVLFAFELAEPYFTFGESGQIEGGSLFAYRWNI